MARKITNDVPEVLLELAREAISLGLSEVRLGFMHMGYDFPDPIEWALWLTKRCTPEEAGAPRSRVVLTAGRERPVPTAYVGPHDAADPYWSVDQVRAWMQEGLLEAGELFPAWEPTSDEALQAQFLVDWDTFREGVLSGWVMKHEVRWSDLVIHRDMEARAAEREGREPRPITALPSTTLGWEATNTFYNKKAHPAYRGKDDSGAPVSLGGYLIRYGNGEGKAHRNLDEPPYMVEVPSEEMLAILTETAPWFVRVAGYDEAREKWKRFPEAKAWKKSDEGMAAAIADTERALAMVRA